MQQIGGWIFFIAIVCIMVFLDLFINRKAHVVSIRESIAWSSLWIGLALAFNVYVYLAYGEEKAINFFTGYIVEKTLSVDNLFVFLLIFNYFNTPSHLLQRVLLWGVIGAIVLRAIFIGLGILIIQLFHWVIYIFAIFLVIVGVRFALQKEKKLHPEKNPLLKVIKKILPITLNYEKDHFLIKKRGKYFGTPLLLVLISIETTDIIFAIDSLPAIFAITQDPFIVFTSNIFAILGLRSLYFLLSSIMILFAYLHYGLAIILVFIGIKMLVSEFFTFPLFFTLGIIIGIISLSILLSILFPKSKNP